MSILELRCAGSSDCGGVLEYVCVLAHEARPIYEAHVMSTIYPTPLGFG